MKSVKAIIRSRIISAPYYGKTIRASNSNGLSFSAEVELIEDHGYLGFWAKLLNVRNIQVPEIAKDLELIDGVFEGFIDEFKLVAARKTHGT